MTALIRILPRRLRMHRLVTPAGQDPVGRSPSQWFGFLNGAIILVVLMGQRIADGRSDE